MSHKICADEARPYWSHPSQQKNGTDPEKLTDDGFEYWADGPVCLGFHRIHWPEVWMVHIGALPEAWGQTEKPVRRILEAFWRSERPDLIVAWVPEPNTLAIRLARRVGFEVGGSMPTPNANILCLNWSLP